MNLKGNILLIDSGVGGLSTLKSLKKILPYEDYIYYADNAHMPYGDKTPDFLIDNACEIISKTAEDYQLKLVVIACNTLTGVAVDILRARFPETIIVGMEPALKPAASNGGRTVVICTLNTGSALIQNRRLYGGTAEILALPMLARMIEENATDDEILEYTGRFLDGKDFSNLVLGCTHYCLKKELFEKAYPYAKIFDGNDGVARRVKHLLEERGLKNDRHFVPSTVLVLSRPERSEISRYVKLLRENI